MVNSMYYLNTFFLYSIFGFIFEHLVYLVMDYKGDSGFLYGPYTPVYGIGVILIFIISDFIFKNLNANKLIQTIIIFITIIVVLSLIELLGGILIEKIFKTTFWDYSNMKYHLGKYICLEVSLVWGFLGILLIYIIKPLTDKLINIIPPFITYSLLLLFIFDIFITLILNTNIKDYLVKKT